MAKQPEKNKKITVIKWVFLIVVPLILAISILFIALSLLGMEPVNRVKEFANQIPVVNQFVTTEEEAQIERLENQYENEITELENLVANLETNLATKSAEVDQLEQERARLNYRIEELILETDNAIDQDEMVAKMIDTYQEMSPANAASIIGNMNQANALTILQDLDDVQRAAILSALNAEMAAELTEELLN